ncbi:hypothetical protein [Formosa haliotis]|uniref:hypothetical protein n=1 Tax=Formosa haliotis TaxID=1555194 RepID=UPI0011467DF7|nr:hypothetical protein [Formosa haliotis]
MKLESTIKTLPESVRLNYSALDVNVFDGGLSVENPELNIIEGAKGRVELNVKLQDIKLKNVGYWDYIVNNTIHLDTILVKGAEISFVRGLGKASDSTQQKDNKPKNENKDAKPKKEFNKIVKIDNFDLNRATLTIFETTKDSIFLKSENINITFDSIYFDANTAKQSIPFEYSDYHVLTDSLKFNAGQYETINLHALELSKKRWVFRQFKLKTKYSKHELSKIIDKERDHFDVSVDSITIEAPEFGSVNKRFYFKSNKVLFQKPFLEVYRDKLVADDNTIKPLYSEMLRNLKFDLTLPSVILKDGQIVYEEKSKPHVNAGTISFHEFNADIKNVSNTYASPVKTELDINTLFMNSAPLHANWTFDVNDEHDTFLFKTQIGKLPVKRLNAFTENNVGIKLEGQFDKIYARIDGNVQRSSIDFDVKYENVKVQILNKKHHKNKFLSTVANIFIRKDSDKADDGFIVKRGHVTRDKTKSVFNFLWLNFKEGLKLVFVGKI